MFSFWNEVWAYAFRVYTVCLRGRKKTGAKEGKRARAEELNTKAVFCPIEAVFIPSILERCIMGEENKIEGLAYIKYVTYTYRRTCTHAGSFSFSLIHLPHTLKFSCYSFNNRLRLHWHIRSYDVISCAK